MKSAADLFLVLRKHGLLTDMRLPPMSVGVHPQNRDGLMLNATDVHQLLDSISQVGFVPSRIDAIAVEIGSEEERLYNQRLVDGVGGALGSIDSQSAQLISQSHELDPATSGEPSKPRLSGAACERSPQLGAGQSSRCSLCRTCGAWAELAGDRQGSC